ncbi:MAG: hypothetical protein QG622_81 [Actinomycetota bacterium]|nr:hypothetical protein [Actinomycetota bacterium]
MIRFLTRWQPWLTAGGRLFLAGVFVLSGWPKLLDAEGTVRSVRAFQILPEALVPAFGYALPVVELAVAGLLLAGLFTRYAALVFAGMMLMFLGGIGAAWARGLEIDCGCFGSTGTLVNDPVPGYIKDIIRDTAFLAVALMVARWPRGVLSADEALGLAPRRTNPPD